MTRPPVTLETLGEVLRVVAVVIVVWLTAYGFVSFVTDVAGVF